MRAANSTRFLPNYNLKDGIKCHTLSNYDDTGDDMQFAGTAMIVVPSATDRSTELGHDGQQRPYTK